MTIETLHIPNGWVAVAPKALEEFRLCAYVSGREDGQRVGWRRQHALASLRACLGVLAFVSEVTRMQDQREFFHSLWIESLTGRPG